jgi:hypothetical protein
MRLLLAVEKVVYLVIPSEARNLSCILPQEKRDCSARSVPRNDKSFSFFATYLVDGQFEYETRQ